MPETFQSIDPVVKDEVYVDISSPSLLRWKNKRNNQVKEGSVAGTLRSDGRWRVNIKGKFYYTYRVYIFIATGVDPIHSIVDHKNGDSRCHAPDNLRVVTRSQNNINRKPRGQYKGVSLHKFSGLWRARLSVNGKEITTYHHSAEQAARAYDKLAFEACGKFAYLNFPDDYDALPTA